MTMLTLAKDLFGNPVSRDYWFGGPGKTAESAPTESLFMFILWVSIISFVMLMVPMCWWAFKYRRGAQTSNYQMSPAHNTPLELAWTIIPLLILIPIFFWGFQGYINKQASPSDAEEIYIRAQKWNWTITYSNGAQAGAEQVWVTESMYEPVPLFYVPAGRPVKLILSSSDVIHAFFIPDFRTKIDVFPNRYTSMWFNASDPTPADPPEGFPSQYKYKDKRGYAQAPGISGHVVYCAEYCGDFHSEMAAFIKVVSPEEFERRKAEAGVIKPEGSIDEWGPKIWSRFGCKTCHTIDGTPGTGPTWKGAWGTDVPLEGGGTAKFDEAYARTAILNSQAQVHQGFPKSMPLYQGVLKPEVVDMFIMYLKHLGGADPGVPGTAPAESAPAGAAPTTGAAPPATGGGH